MVPQGYCHQANSYWLIVRLTALSPRYCAHVLTYTPRLARHGFVSLTITCVINLLIKIRKADFLLEFDKYKDVLDVINARAFYHHFIKCHYSSKAMQNPSGLYG